MKKIYTLIVLFSLLFCYTGNVWGETLTVAEGTKTTYQTPVYGYYCDKYVRSQIIYPASILTSMSGNNITAMTFYFETPSSAALTSTFQLYLKEVESTTTTLSTSWTDMTSATKVFEGTIEANNTTTKTLVIEFDTPFLYNGGSLIFDLKNTASGGSYAAKKYGEYTCVFYGRKATADESSTLTGYATSSTITPTRGDIRPKTTFTYEAAGSATCPKPTALTRGTTTTTSVAYTWTAGDSETSWQYICLPAASTIDWTSASVQTANTTPAATITGLSAGTSYTFYVRAYCATDDQSAEVKETFSTKHGLPFSENFNNLTTAGQIPSNWDNIEGTTTNANYKWSYNASGHNGACVRFESCYNYTDYTNFLKTPTIEISGPAKLSFYYKHAAKSFSLYYSIDDGDKQVIEENIATTSSWTEKVIDLPAECIGNVKIIFKGTSNYGSSTNMLWVDDILIESTQDCSKPATPTYSDLTGSSVTLSWTANAGVTDYKYLNIDRTANPSATLDWSSASSVTGTSVDLTSLTDGHNYEFYVMCACGTVASDACEYTPLSCPTVTGVTLSNQLYNAVTVNWTTSATTNCDVQYKAGAGDWTAAETNTSATSKTITGLSVGTTYSFRVKPNCSADVWVSPASSYAPVCPALGDLTLSNKTYNSVTVSWSEVAGISSWTLKYRKGSDDWTVVSDIDALTYTIASGLETNQEYTIELYSECGGTPASTTYTPVYEIPSVLTASPVKDVTATLNWSTVDGASGYQYSCVPTGNSDAWSATQVANSASLSGLTAGIEYTAKVRAVFGGSNYSDPKEKVFSTVCQAPTSLVKGATTSTSLTFSWSKSAASNADNRYQYVCKEGSTAPTADQWANDAVLLAEGVRSATVEGLKSNTTYYFFVRSYYGDGKYSNAINTNNTTDCGINNIGWSENFNAGSVPTCWTVSNKTSYGWATYGYTDEMGSYCMRYNGRGSSGYYELFATPSILLNDKAVLKFYRKTTTTSPEFKVLISKDGGTTKTEIGSYSASTSKRADSISLVDYVNETVIIYFQGKSSNTSSRYVYLDDVDVHYLACAKPTSLAAAPTADGAEVTWDAEEGPYDLQYRLNGSSDEWTAVNSISDKNYTIEGLTSGTEYEVRVRAHASEHRISDWTASETFTPSCTSTNLSATAITHNSATISWNGNAKAIRYKTGATAWSNETISPAATTINISGLAAESTYTVQVKADCEDGDNWSTELEFTTKCAPITIIKAAPYEADFSDLTNEMPACWEKSKTTYPYVTSSELKFFANETNQTAILPAFSNDIASLKLKFKYKNYSGMSGYGKLQVGYIDNAGDFQAVGSTLTNKANYDDNGAEVDFDGVTNAKNIAIRFLDNSYSSAYSYVKDIVVELAPTCYAPASINEPTGVTSTGATITWAASSKNNETHYQYICVPAGETPNWNNSTKVEKAVSNTASLTGLNPYTSYDFYVRSWCSADDQSEAISKNFETECGTYSMPFVEDFATTTLSKCWTVTGTSTSSYNWKVYTDEYGHKGSTYRARFTANTNNASGKTGSLESPSITLTNDAALHFYYSNPKGASLKVYIKEGDNDRVELADLSDATNAWTGQNILIPETYNTKTVKFYFDAVSNATSNSYVDIDQVHVNHMLKDSKNNSTLLASLNGQTVDVTLGRTLVAAEYYNTLCLPFSLSTLTGTPLEGGDLWAFKYAKVDETTDELLFRIVQSDHIEAGVPYFIAFPNNAEDIVNPFFENVTISATTGQKIGDASVAQFCGILQPETLVAGDATKLFLAAENTLYWWNGASDSTLKSFRAYFSVNTGGGSSSAPIRRGMPARIIREEQVATGAENAQDNGARCIKMIENEQLIIIRDGVKYNVQGQKIQ